MDFVRILFAILLPPLGVFLQEGIGLQFWINILANPFRIHPRHHPRRMDYCEAIKTLRRDGRYAPNFWQATCICQGQTHQVSSRAQPQHPLGTGVVIKLFYSIHTRILGLKHDRHRMPTMATHNGWGRVICSHYQHIRIERCKLRQQLIHML